MKQTPSHSLRNLWVASGCFLRHLVVTAGFTLALLSGWFQAARLVFFSQRLQMKISCTAEEVPLSLLTMKPRKRLRDMISHLFIQIFISYDIPIISQEFTFSTRLFLIRVTSCVWGKVFGWKQKNNLLMRTCVFVLFSEYFSFTHSAADRQEVGHMNASRNVLDFSQDWETLLTLAETEQYMFNCS